MARARSRPPIRLRAVPPLDPPFEDESAAGWMLGTHGQLALDFAPSQPPAGPSHPPGSQRPSRRRPSPPLHPLPLPQGPPTTASAEARQAARRFLLTCVEVFNGYRPVAHIRALATRTAAANVVGQLTTGAGRLAAPRRRGAVGREPVRVRRIRVCEPRSGVVEAAAVLSAGGRVRALAFRLERCRGSWSVTALRVL